MDGLCTDCGMNTFKDGEYYMVTDDVWQEGEGGRDLLCIGCLETRIGRSLMPEDFKPVPLNRMFGHHKSLRLLSRMCPALWEWETAPIMLWNQR